MANLPIKDGNAVSTFIKATGTGADSSNPYEPVHQVEGLLASGAIASGANPVLFAGYDGLTLRTILTDTLGRLLVISQGLLASGAIASGANPVLFAGSDGTNLRTILTDSQGRQVIGGQVANNATSAGNPMQISGDSSGTSVRLACDSSGRQYNFMLLSDTSSITNVAWNNGDGLSTPKNGPAVSSLSWDYNESTLDRRRNNSATTVLSSSSRSSTTNSSDQTNYNGRGVRLWLDVTVASGVAPKLDVSIQDKDAVSSNYVTIASGNFATITASGTSMLTVYPGINAVPNVQVNACVGRTWRAVATLTSGISFTYSIGAVHLV